MQQDGQASVRALLLIARFVAPLAGNPLTQQFRQHRDESQDAERERRQKDPISIACCHPGPEMSEKKADGRDPGECRNCETPRRYYRQPGGVADHVE